MRFINKYLVKLEKILLCSILFSMILLSFGQVLLRLLISLLQKFNIDFYIDYTWVSPFLTTEVLWIVFLGSALATEYRQHIKIDFLVNMTKSQSRKKLISTDAQVFALVVSLILFLVSTDYIRIMGETNDATMISGIPDWIILLIIPYSFFMIFLRSIFNIQDIVSGKLDNRPEGDKAAGATLDNGSGQEATCGQ